MADTSLSCVRAARGTTRLITLAAGKPPRIDDLARVVAGSATRAGTKLGASYTVDTTGFAAAGTVTLANAPDPSETSTKTSRLSLNLKPYTNPMTPNARSPQN